MTLPLPAEAVALASDRSPKPIAADTGRKLAGLQVARAAAALAVVFCHAISHPLPAATDLAQFLGQTGVTLFFAISGFIMVTTTGRGSFDPFSFLRRRVRRIVPLYYVATAISVVGVLAAPRLFKDTTFDLRHITLSLLFIPAPLPKRPDVINPFLRLGWTLEYEMFFYLAFAALFALNDIRRVVVLTAVFAALVGVGALHAFETPVLRFFTQVDLLGFVAGAWVGILLRRGTAPAGRAWMGLLVVVAAGLAATACNMHALRHLPLLQPMLVAFCAIAVLLFATATWRAGPARRTLVYLGDASYSIYLFHMIGIGAAYVMLRHVAMPSGEAVSIAVATLLGTFCGLAAYELIEQPLQAAVHRTTKVLTPSLPPLRSWLAEPLDGRRSPTGEARRGRRADVGATGAAEGAFCAASASHEPGADAVRSGASRDRPHP